MEKNRAGSPYMQNKLKHVVKKNFFLNCCVLLHYTVSSREHVYFAFVLTLSLTHSLLLMFKIYFEFTEARKVVIVNFAILYSFLAEIIIRRYFFILFGYQGDNSIVKDCKYFILSFYVSGFHDDKIPEMLK